MLRHFKFVKTWQVMGWTDLDERCEWFHGLSNVVRGNSPESSLTLLFFDPGMQRYVTIWTNIEKTMALLGNLILPSMELLLKHILK